MSSKVTNAPAESEVTNAKVTPGTLFVVSSPSGGGKGTLIRRVLDTVPNLSYSISYTTRTPRNGEVHGREYFFVNRETFEAMVRANEFLEWACVHGNLYGTAKQQVALETAAGTDIVLEVDVQGAASIRNLTLDTVSVFILPPSYETLKERLIARGTDSPEQLALRLKNAPEELRQFSCFDYVIINDDVERAANQLASIIYGERARCERQDQVVKEVIQNFQSVE
ncbi:MAG TPA: guanylate kinase [Pyrinomonadaceae bacterium]|nr:guanylate kinase [Pyrinomonadaceae bacterium]